MNANSDASSYSQTKQCWTIDMPETARVTLRERGNEHARPGRPGALSLRVIRTLKPTKNTAQPVSGGPGREETGLALQATSPHDHDTCMNNMSSWIF